ADRTGPGRGHEWHLRAGRSSPDQPTSESSTRGCGRRRRCHGPGLRGPNLPRAAASGKPLRENAVEDPATARPTEGQSLSRGTLASSPAPDEVPDAPAPGLRGDPLLSERLSGDGHASLDAAPGNVAVSPSHADPERAGLSGRQAVLGGFPGQRVLQG